MADELKTDKLTPGEKEGGKVVFESQADFDAVIERRLARDREKYADYDKTKEELETLRQEKKKLEEKELTTTERLKKDLEEVNKKLSDTISDRDTYKKFHDDYEANETKAVDELSKDLTEKQKDLISKLPLSERRAAISEFTNAKPAPGNWGKGTKQNEDGLPTNEELTEARSKYGPSSPQYTALLNKRMGRK